MDIEEVIVVLAASLLTGFAFAMYMGSRRMGFRQCWRSLLALDALIIAALIFIWTLFRSFTPPLVPPSVTGLLD